MPAGLPTPSKPVKPSKPKRPRPTQDESVNAVRMQNWNREMLAWEAAIEQHATAMQQREADKAAGRHAQRRTDAGAMEVFAGTDVEGTDVEEAATTTAIVSEEAATATDVADMIAEAVSGRAGSSSAVADAASSSAVVDAAKPSPSDRMLRAATADLEAQRMHPDMPGPMIRSYMLPPEYRCAC